MADIRKPPATACEYGLSHPAPPVPNDFSLDVSFV